MSKTAVFCIAKSRAQAERIMEHLVLFGFAYSDISILMPETESGHDIGHVKATKAPEGTVAGVAGGGAVGGVIGLLAGIGTLAIPGIGPFLAAGPIMAALSGAAVGAATGGVVGGLIGLGIPEIEAKIYDGKLKTGNYLLSVHAHDSKAVDRAKEIFQAENAEDISSTGEASVPGQVKPETGPSMAENLSTHPEASASQIPPTSPRMEENLTTHPFASAPTSGHE